MAGRRVGRRRTKSLPVHRLGYLLQRIAGLIELRETLVEIGPEYRPLGLAEGTDFAHDRPDHRIAACLAGRTSPAAEPPHAAGGHPAGPPPARPVDHIPVRQRPGPFLPVLDSRHRNGEPHGGRREPVSEARLPGHLFPHPGRRRRPFLPALQPLPDRRLRPAEAGDVAFRGRFFGADPFRPDPDAGLLCPGRRGGLPRPLQDRRLPLGRTGGDPDGVLLVLAAVLQRHGRHREHAFPVRRAARLSRHGGLRPGGPLPAAPRQGVCGVAAGMAGLCVAARLHRARLGPGARQGAAALPELRAVESDWGG